MHKNDRYLHKIARQVVSWLPTCSRRAYNTNISVQASDVQELAASNPTVGFTLVLQLTGTNGTQQFDRQTNTKTVETILANMDLKGVKEYLKYLLARVNEKGDGIEATRTWIIEQLSTLLRRSTIPKDEECATTIVNWLTTHAFYEVKKKNEKSPNFAVSCSFSRLIYSTVVFTPL